MLSLKFSDFKTHLFAWLLFIVYELSVNYSINGHFANAFDYLFFYSLNISLFYIHARVIQICIQTEKWAYLGIAFSIVIEIAIYLILKDIITHLYHSSKRIDITRLDQLIPFIRDSSWRAIYFIGLSTAYAFGRFALVSQKEISTMVTKQLETQLKQEILEKDLLANKNAFLKAQVNPHFLFNTLNMVYDQVSQISEPAGDLIISLSEVLRFACLDVEDGGLVKLSDELNHIDNYLLLNHARFNNKLHLQYSANSDYPKQIKIIPLALITIIENVFKYAELSEPANPANIEIRVSSEKIQCFVQNKKKKKYTTESLGIGMTNIQKRLSQVYGDRHLMEINQNETEYNLKLSINLNTNDLLCD
jgi:two-component system, LytTR family, sensor kinase